MSMDLSKINGVPRWAVGTVLVLGMGWGARQAFVQELERTEARCQQAVTAAEARSQERYQTKLEAAQAERALDKEIRAVLIEARRIR